METALKRLRESDDHPPGTMVNMLVEEAIRLTRSTIGYFAVLDVSGTALTMLAWSTSAMAACRMMEKPLEYPLEATGLWGDCIREGQAVITNDYENCTRPTRKGYPDGHVPVKRHMNVPVCRGPDPAGILGVGNKQEEYTEEDASLLQAFADAAWPILAQFVERPTP